MFQDVSEASTTTSFSHFLYTKYTLPETNIFAENGWLEDDPFLLGFRPIFRGYVYVIFKDATSLKLKTLIFPPKKTDLMCQFSMLGFFFSWGVWMNKNLYPP